MNRTLKRIVPIAMIIVIVLCVSWYLIVYDRTFTRDMMLNLARISDMNGSQKLASYFYDRAYVYSGNDEDVAIELANQYIADGNYTKAEYTLSTAISHDPSASLYVALSKTYIAQDKLLDSLNMLDNIADPAIKSQLDFLRPAAPEATPAPGFYNQYIPVTITAESGTIYYNLDGEYPSVQDSPYTEPVVLPGGETTIYAVTVSESGLVSPVTVLAYTVGGVIEPAEFTDPALDAAVRSQLGFDGDDAIYTNDLWAITEFTVPAEANSIQDLQLLTHVKELTVEGMRLDSLSCLEAMFQLETLTLRNCRFPADDLALLSRMPELKKLTLSGCGLSTIEGLTGAPALTELDLSDNTIRNLSPLSQMHTLRAVYLQHNAVVDLNTLSGLTGLETLDVSYNSITNLAALTSCASLSWLKAEHNSISNLAGVGILDGLEYLNLNNNKITDAATLGNCVNLTELHLAYNELKSVKAFSSLMKLEVLDFSHNTVSEVPVWANGAALRIIDGSYNQVTSINSLKNLEQLIYIYMDYNQITSISALSKLPKLLQINVYGNAISDVSSLESNHIIVNYDPTLA